MTDGDASGRASVLVSVLRLAAVALVVVGFSGWLIDHDGTVVLESPYTIAFGVGVACALASIYLGIFLANGGSAAETAD
ncbi:hypothetical protein D8Y22_05685 [Salinadaptatus halalkaliphilus]|uniref:Uncharacterized protein n=1 Tax=Salinadaptatus halalkaliphilus TaxID=2419781 RepID=A0A4V3VLJ1_9EURY|nr:hypothetical protein [Salinadaptatus halalkaliphilus]THE65807.1 hypothetical protein D8Y22_05685 [Salinadaptatus halalkaliphilus]